MSGARWFLASLVLLLAVLVPRPSHGQPNRASIVVMPLKGASFAPRQLEAINSLLVLAADELGPHRVVTRDDLEAQLSREKLKDLLGCNSVVCAAEIGDRPGLARMMLDLGSNPGFGAQQQ